MNKKLLLGVVIIVIIAGIVMGITNGFNLGLMYNDNEKIELNLGRQVTTSEVKELAKEVFTDKKINVQTVEIFEDTVAITVANSTDEEIENLVKLVNERYGQEYTKDDVNIIKVAHKDNWDIVKKYIVPFAIIVVVIALYMAIRYNKQGALKIAIISIINNIMAIAVLGSLYTIIRIPVNDYAMPIALVVLVLTTFATSNYYETKSKKMQIQETEVEK